MKIKDFILNGKKNWKLATIVLVLFISVLVFTLFFIRSFEEITKPVYDAFRKKTSTENKEIPREPEFSPENSRDWKIEPADKLSPEILSRKPSGIPADVISKESFSEVAGSFKKLEGTGVSLASYSTSMKISNPAKFNWQIYTDTGNENPVVEKTFLCWSKNPIPDPALDKYNSFSGEQRGNINQIFAGAPEFSSAGEYYLRAFARINSNDYWSDEIKVSVAR